MLPLTMPILAFIALSISFIFKFVIYPGFISPLSKIPNAHWTSPYCPFWILLIRARCKENTTIHAAHLKYGPVVRLAPSELSINDLSGVRTVYGGGLDKGQWYSIFDNYGVPCMFSTSHSRHHSARKRMISHVYSKSVIHSSEAFARQAQVILYERLLPAITIAASAFQSPDGVDAHELWNATTMDFITAYLFGLKNGSNFLKDKDYRRHWLNLYYSRKRYTFFPQELPRLTRFMKKIGIHLVPTWVNDANEELEAWTQNLCDDTIAYLRDGAATDSDAANEPVVMNAILAGINKEKNLKGRESILKDETLKYPELSIASEMIDHLAAGHETSGITLTYFTWQISRDLPLQRALRAELNGLSPNMKVSGNSQALPNPKDLDALPLLHAILMETLRLRAAIPGGQPRMTPYPACSLSKFHDIPGGVRVGAQAYSIHRNESVFPNPEQWDHTRWLDNENELTEEEKRERDRTFWAFSSGGRMCIGSNFAVYEIKLIIAAVYSNFETTIVDDEGIEQIDGYTCGPKSNRLFLKFERVVEK